MWGQDSASPLLVLKWIAPKDGILSRDIRLDGKLLRRGIMNPGLASCTTSWNCFLKDVWRCMYACSFGKKPKLQQHPPNMFACFFSKLVPFQSQFLFFTCQRVRDLIFPATGRLLCRVIFVWIINKKHAACFFHDIGWWKSRWDVHQFHQSQLVGPALLIKETLGIYRGQPTADMDEGAIYAW